MKHIDQTLIKLLIVDNQEISLTGLCAIFKKSKKVNVVARTKNYDCMLSLAIESKPHVIIIDINAEHQGEIFSNMSEVRKHLPSIEVIALVHSYEEELVIKMLETGIKGCLLKMTSEEELLMALSFVVDHQNYLCADISNNLFGIVKENTLRVLCQKDKLLFSKREEDIILLICNESCNREIAQKLNLSIRTVEGYREKILEKMDVRNTAGIVIYAIKNKIYSL